MTEQTTDPITDETVNVPSPQVPRDAANWAQPVSKLTVKGERAGALNLNVAGKGLTGPLQGFGAPPMPVSTGVLILYADDESFSVMSPDGHPESGFNTFSALEEDGVTICQIQSLARANAPVYEFGFRFMGGGAQQEQIWRHVLSQIAQHFGVEPAIEVRKTCVDNRLQWSKAKNVWHNAVIRTTASAPVRWTKKALGRSTQAVTRDT